MIREDVRRWATRLGVIAVGAAVLVGCPERADEITEPASEAAVNFPVATNFVTPGGPLAVDGLKLAQIDTAAGDAFSRGGDLFNDEATFFAFGGAAGAPPDWESALVGAAEDPRLPALDPDAFGLFAVTTDEFAEEFLGVPGAVVFSIEGLEPNTEYLLTFERLGLMINEGLDHSNAVLDNPDLQTVPPFLTITNPDAPDELVRLGGTEGTAPGANPYLAVIFDTDGLGATGLVAFGFAGIDDGLDTNTLEAFDLPQYNYAVVYEGTTTAGPPVLRAQFGVDLLASTEEPVNNAFGPFPADSFATSEMIAASGGAGSPDSVSVVFSNMEELQGGTAYTAWLVNAETGDQIPALANYNRIEITLERDPITGEVTGSSEEVVETTAGANSFVGGNQGDGFRHELIISDQQLGGGAADSVGFYTHLYLTVDENPGDDSPGDVRPFWFQFTNQGGTPANFFDDEFFDGEMQFGNFDAANSANSRVYNGAGVGQGGFRANVLSVDIQNLTRPPIGYQLSAWLLPAEGDPVQLPPITGPPPARIDLTNADVDASSDLVTQTGILNANFRVVEGDIPGNFQDYLTFQVALEPKAGAAGMSPIPVYLGTVPELLRNRE